MSELKVTTLKHADSTVDSIVMASDGTLAFGAAVADSAGVAIQGGAAAQAWVNFNGTGTVAIRRAFNVSSITDNGTGDQTVNFTTAMVDANYSICGQASLGVGGTDPRIFGAAGSDPTASSFEVATTTNGGIQENCEYVCVTIFS
jgi:hypothetical protein